eukprot:SAG31_NODE_3895_length_3773_cov_21.681818_1_plen_67_part_10
MYCTSAPGTKFSIRLVGLVRYGRPAAYLLLGGVPRYQGMYTRAVHSTVCGTIQLTTKCTNSKFCYQF